VKYALALLAVLPLAAQQAQLDANQTLFNVMVAINAAGYDADADSPNNNPLRKAVREAVAKQNLSTVAELKKFFAAHRKKDWTGDLSQYISFALAVDGTDQYKWRFKLEEIPPDALSLEGFGALMTRFHQQAQLDELWKQVKPVHEQALERFHDPITNVLQQATGYLRVPATGNAARRFYVYVDLMAAPNNIQARSYGDDFYVILTSSQDTHAEEVRHSYIGFLVDPLATRHADKIEKKRPLIDLAQAAPLLPEAYKSDFLLLTTKCLTRAVEARLAPAAKRDAMIAQALAEGYILAPYFAEALVLYEKQEQAMRFHYPEMIDNIDLKREDKRLANVQFSSQAIVKTVKVAPAEQKAELTGVPKLLEEAEDLYAARKLAEARAKFLEAAEQTKERVLQSRAYYGLARIAALEKNPELAVKLFQQTLDLEPEAAIRAWAHVYLGRLLELGGEPTEAARHFDDALKVEGATRAARDSATKAAQDLKKRMNP
jgi:tetratricopeptide (TPR) repeat protein